MNLLASSLSQYAPVDNDLLTAIEQVGIRRKLPKGTILLSQGQLMHEVHFIEQGLVRGFYYHDQREITSWLVNEGRFIWPLPAYLLRRPSRETIQVLEPTTVLSFSRAALDQLKQEFAVFDDLQCRLMERYIVLYDLRVQMLLLRADERFDAYERVFPELARRVPLRYIASYLGIDPATLSRFRRQYKTKKNP